MEFNSLLEHFVQFTTLLHSGTFSTVELMKQSFDANQPTKQLLIHSFRLVKVSAPRLNSTLIKICFFF